MGAPAGSRVDAINPHGYWLLRQRGRRMCGAQRLSQLYRSAHSFSADGFRWHMSAVPPYGTQVRLADGSAVTVATRERPKLFFDAAGKKTHLINGVCSAPNCPNGPSTGCVDCKYADHAGTLLVKLGA